MIRVQVNQASHSLGIASLVVGVLSFFLCWIPFIGVVVSGLGLFLGAVGLFLATVRRGSGLGYSIAGVGLSGLSLTICLAWTLTLQGTFKGIAGTRTPDDRINQLLPDGGPETQFGEPAVPEIGDEATAVGAATGKSPPADQKADWVDAAKVSIQQENVRVRVRSVVVDFLTGKDFRDFKSKDKALKITIAITNTDQNRKLDYRGWGGSETSLADDAPHLSDSFVNTYKRVHFGLASRIDGQIVSKSIYPGESVDDLLVYEKPVRSVEYLLLELPASNFGGTGKLRFRIPSAMIDAEKQAAEERQAAAAERKAAEQSQAAAKKAQEKTALEAERAALEAERADKNDPMFRTWALKSLKDGTVDYFNGRFVTFDKKDSRIVVDHTNGKRIEAAYSRWSKEDQQWVETELKRRASGAPPKQAVPRKGQPVEKKPEIAESWLKSARTLLEQGNRESAKRWLQKVVDEYPDTAAADEAKALLEKLK